MNQNLKKLIQQALHLSGIQITRFPDANINSHEFGNFLDGMLIVCNFCGTIFQRTDGLHSESLSCPYCGTIARERVVYQCILNEISRKSGISTLVINHTKELRDYRILECSPRFNDRKKTICFETIGQYVTSDFDMSGHPADILLDLTNTQDVSQYQNYFDIIICAHVLEHILDYKRVLENLHLMLAEGGMLILQVPILEKEYSASVKEEYHADNTRVYHHFAFDLVVDLERIYRRVNIVVALLDFPITSTEIHPGKYEILLNHKDKCLILGDHLVKFFGLGLPDLCEAFIAYK